jgi:hypothetical protein
MYEQYLRQKFPSQFRAHVKERIPQVTGSLERSLLLSLADFAMLETLRLEHIMTSSLEAISQPFLAQKARS